MDAVTKIGALARKALGRRASRSTKCVDWDAVEAVKRAAVTCGLGRPLAEWVRPADTSITAIARSFVCRYVQAYGPLGRLIDAGGHVGGGSCVVVV